MNEAQYYTLIAVPLAGILLNGILFMALGGRIDKVIEKLGEIDSRVAVLEDRKARGQ